MQQSASRFMIVAVLSLVAATLTACGGGGSNSGANVVAKLNVSPTSISLNKGGLQQLSVQALDSNGTAAVASFTFASSNENAATVSPSGLVCAGKWDSKFIVCCPGQWADTAQTACTPGMPVGTADITVTSSSVSVKVPTYVHDRVDVLKIVPPAQGCVSMAGTAQYTAKAFTRDPSVCPNGANVPCEIPAATLGPLTFVSNDASVASFDNTTADKQGVATAGIPGQTSVFASLSSNNSPSVAFQTCPIKSLSITVKDSTAAPFAFDKGNTKPLVATAIDSNNTTLPAPPIQWVTSQPFSVTVPLVVSTDNLNANATASTPGASTLMAVCSMPSCNRNLDPVFSNVIPATVNGTAAGVVYAASTTSKSVVPIDITTNTPGTTVTLPNLPNSFLADRLGTNGVLGSDAASMILNLATNAASSIGAVGRVLGFSADGSSFVLSSPASNTVSVIAVSSNGNSGSFFVPGGADAVDYTPDGRYILAVKGNKIYKFNLSVGSLQTDLGATSADVAVLAQGSAALVTVPGQIQVRATCDSNLIDSPAATNPTLVAAVPNGDGALVYDNGSLVRLSNVTLNQSCPPQFNADRTVIDVHGGSAKARQLLISPDSKKAFITTDTGNLLTYDLTTGAATPIALAGGATESFTMAISLDSKMLYVGAKDGKVHRIDTTTMTDVQQIDPALKQADGTTVAVPDLIVIKNK